MFVNLMNLVLLYRHDTMDYINMRPKADE